MKRNLQHAKKAGQKALALVTAMGMTVSLLPATPLITAKAAFSGMLEGVEKVEKGNADNIVMVTFKGGVQAKLTFLEDGIFRYNVDPSGKFSKYAEPKYNEKNDDRARIQQYPDESNNYKHPSAAITDDGTSFTVKSGDVSVIFDKATAKMTVKEGNKTVMQEQKALTINPGKTVQTLAEVENENFYGGGTQNGRFVHTGETLNIVNEGNWVDGGVSSPNPFYYTTAGYGVLRNTFQPGHYDFGDSTEGTVTTSHDEGEFDAYYFISGADTSRGVVQEVLQDYFHVTGNPILLPEYGFYVGHLNALNRDAWSETSGSKGWTMKGTDPATSAGTTLYETGMDANFVLQSGMEAESLNGENEVMKVQGTLPDGVTTPYKYSARKVIDDYAKYDMPLGYVLPNDGYGSGYGKNGYFQTSGTAADRQAALDANIENLKSFADYAKSKGVEVGLWTQSYLSPEEMPSNTRWHNLRDFRKEVGAGVSTLKTDVAWVSPGYSMQLSGVKFAYEIATDTATTANPIRPNIISVDGWAGSQRYNGFWTGDQAGGNWEYIRFHIPTYIGQSLSGNPNTGSDVDGIHGGSDLISTRDYQWKTFSQIMMDMDGWGSYAKFPYTHGDPYTGINRMYLKTKAKLMPYLYTSAFSASNIDTGNKDTGLPMIRAMFLEYPDDAYASTKNMQYQYMFGPSVLVAPVYQDTEMDGKGNDVRNNIYLPGKDDVWVDFFTGDQYKGGQILNNFDAPLWKLPVFVKNGSIIPQYEENNSAAQIKKENRIVEFWPAGNTEYTAVEDDGTYVENKTTTDSEYGVIDDVSYGDHVSTKYTSKVNGATATLTAEKSTGSYTGYKKDKNTTFVVHVSKEPTGVTAKNGNAALTLQKVTSKEAFDKTAAASGKAVYFYDANPSIENYVPDTTKETEFQNMVKDVKVAPKLYVKFAQADAKTTAQTLEITGFENQGDFPADKVNTALAVPTLTEDEAAKTPTSVTLSWNKVDGATSYELMIDGRLYSVGTATTYTHTDLGYASEHTYQVRSRNAEGYSAWSTEMTFKSADDPFRDTPEPVNIDWKGGIYADRAVERAFDHEFQSGDGGFHSDGSAVGKWLIVDYGKAYEFDKIEYYPRDDAGNGTVTQMEIWTSLDGVNWLTKTIFDWDRNAEMKTAMLDTAARYIAMTPRASVGSFFSASEIKMYAKDMKGFTVGSTIGKTIGSQEVVEADYTNMKQYLGECPKDSTFDKQIKSLYGDINGNNFYDVYDYAFTMFKLDGGTTKTGKVAGTPSFTVSGAAEDGTVEAGKEVTITMKVANPQNVNALGQIFTYDSAKLEYVQTAPSDILKGTNMEDLTINKVYADGSAYLNLAYANRGNQDTLNGEGGDIVAITFKAKEAVKLNDPSVIKLGNLVLIGPDYSTIGEIGASSSGEPSDQPVQYAMDDFDITVTNELLPEDDGTNVTKLINQKSYDGLFDGSKGRDFEFLWDIDSNHDPETGKLPAHITLPITLHFALKEPAAVNKLIVYNANKGNGYMTAVSAKVNYEDGTSSDEITSSLDGAFADWKDNSQFTFDWDSEAAVTSVDVTILSAVGSSGSEVKNMLTMAEIEMYQGIDKKADAIEKLQALIDECGGLNNDNGTYTDESWNAFAAALDVANEKVADTWAGLDDITEAYDALFNAYNGLEENVATTKKLSQSDLTVTMTNEFLPTDDGSNLEKMINQKSYDGLFDGNKARDFELLWNIESNYDPATGKLPEYVSLPFTMHFTLKYPEAVTKAVVYNANKANGYMTAVKAKFNYTDGTSTEEVTKSLPGEFASWADYSAFTFTKASEKPVASVDVTVLSAVSSSGADTDCMVTISEVELFAGPTEVAQNKTDLNNAINEYKDLSNDDNKYTPGSWAKFAAALEAAQTVAGDETAIQSTVDKAVADLNAAYAALTEQANRTELNAEIDKYKDLTNDDNKYTPNSWNKFSKSLEAAKAAAENGDATQSAVDTALANLKRDAEALALRADVTALNAEIAKYAAMNNDTGAYTADTWSTLQTALEEAKKVAENANAAQEAVDNALSELKKAGEGLKKTTDYSEINKELLNYSQVTNRDNVYTADSWNAYNQALAEALKVQKNPEATQEQINAAITALKNAYAALTKTEDVPPKKGETRTSGYYAYKVTGDATVDVVGLADKGKSLKKLTIFSSVTLGGKKYKVTGIGANAFKNNKKITSVTVKSPVATIGSSAFAGCTKLKSVSIKSTSLKSIGAKAFSGDKKLKTIVIKSKKLKKVGKQAFKSIYKKAAIKVPAAKLKSYKKILKKGNPAKTVKIKK